MKPSSQSPRTPSRIFNSCVFLFVTCLFLSGISSAAPSITLSKKSGPPTSRILVSGRGFEPNVGVDIYFGTKDEALIVTNGQGEFKNAGIRAPRSAPPGKHWVTALERNNDKGAQQPFLVQTNWSQFQFAPDRDGSNPYENVLNSRTVRSLDLKWSYLTTNNVWGSPAVVDGMMYFATSSLLYALDSKSGAFRWKAPPPIYNLFSSDLAVANGIVYVGLFGDGLQTFDAKTGTAMWNYGSAGKVFSSPAVANGIVYFDDGENNQDGGVYALNAKTGKLLWFSPTYSSFCSAAVADGAVYVGADDENVYALDAYTGTKLWSYTTAGVVRSTPAVANGMVYVGSFDKMYMRLMPLPEPSSGASRPAIGYGLHQPWRVELFMSAL